jgi:DNA-binding PadR family transcriptional regulator
MSVAHALLGLLDPGPSHGYELKRGYDTWFGNQRPVSFGQVYGTLSRLLRDGRVTVDGVEAGDGPDRKRYVITPEGVTVLERWLVEPEELQPDLQTALFTKIVLALMTGRSAQRFVDVQRAALLGRMRELTALRRSGSLTQVLLADHALFHLEADLRWIDLTQDRLAELAAEVAR